MACLMGLTVTAGAADDPLRRAAVPDNGRITVTDYGYRQWGPELVHYTLDTTRFRPGRLVLLDAAGEAVPFQIDGSVLAFVASVPKGGSCGYVLASCTADRSAENTTLTTSVRDGRLEVRNEHLALRLPAPGEKTYARPVDASKAEPPILQWAGRDGAWMGRARFVSPRKVVSYAAAVVRRGPACVEYEARYRFVPDGTYVWRIRLSPNMPLAVVTEEFDSGGIGEGEDLLLLDLHAGWRPEHVGWVGGAGEQRMPAMSASAFGEYVEARKRSAAEA
ncbi:MAG: hypothetical protein WBF17_01370, partial [Phycisphaerae bacterium]